GGTRPYRYILNNDSNYVSPNFIGLKAGTYQIVVLDSLGCKKTLNATITQPNTVFNANATLVQKKCFSDLGSITIVPSGGNSPYFYAINNGSLLTNPTFSNLNHGVYALKARDFNGCERNFTRVIDTVTQVLVNATKTEPSCGLSNGSIRLSGSGGKAPYRYKFGSGAYGKDSLFINLTSGTYAVSVIDTNGCVTNSNILLNSATPINLSLSSTPESCNGANDGTATAIVSGGTLPYTFQWNSNPIQTSAMASGLKAAWYTLRLTDAASCTKLDSVQVMQKATILAQPLCIISTDTLFNYSVLAWQKNAGLGIAAYNIYRSNTSTGPWSLIHTHPFALPALVADTTLPITTSRAFYQITALDSCNIESSASVAHRGLLLTRTAVGSAQKLDWTAYVGGNVGTSFDVYRRTNGGGFFSIASLPITTRTYTDSSIIAGSKEYIIEMNWTGSCAGAPSNRIISNKITVNSTGLVQAAGLNTKLLVYPNPAKGELFVETENRLAQILKVEMYSLSGVLIGSKDSYGVNKITLEINALAKGMY
ncbi:MAG: T9SS type A sorting domain-containing protein, partial [Bacteroidetes bacterium]|nr:T9SS type A sorting domain-containing protein [Bacteroidota bacterium]